MELGTREVKTNVGLRIDLVIVYVFVFSQVPLPYGTNREILDVLVEVLRKN